MKQAAAAIDVGNLSDGIPFFVIDVKNDKLKLFKDEESAEKYLDKHYTSTIVLLGMIDDPTPYYKILNKEYKRRKNIK